MNIMPNTSLLGILSLKLIFSFGFLNTVNANESFDICEIKTNYRTYTNKSRSRSSYTGAVTQSGEMTCRQIDRNTYQITIDGRARYIHRSAVISTRPQSLAVERSLRPLPRPRVTESAPAAALPTSLNEPLRSNSGEIAAQPSGLTIQNGIIGSSETPAYHVTISTKNAPEIPSGAADATLAPEAHRLTEPTRLLESAGWVTPRSEPSRDSGFACSVVVDGSCSTGRTQVGTIDHNVVLIPTGERTYDSDHKEWYFKAGFEHAGQSYQAWFAEKQTEIDPHEAIVREQTAQRVQDWLNGAPGSIYGTDEVASDESYQLSMTPEDVSARSLTTGFDPNASYEVASGGPPTEAERQEAQRLFPNSTYDGRRSLLRLHPGGDGLCGSIASNTSNPASKSYTAPITACALARLTQTWRERFCPNNDMSCRLSFGNISHPRDQRFGNPRHQTHTHGNCVDIRPIRNSGNSALTWESNNYNQRQTRNLLNLLKEMGAESVYFNDPDMIRAGLSSRISGHDNHIHFCFRNDNRTAERQCASFEPDAKMCPTSEILFNHPTMIDFIEELRE